MSADNQQERLRIVGWIVGFVEGEGTFSISIFRNKTSSLGWQVFPEFVVTQSDAGKDALEKIKFFFRCGAIYRNTRYDNHRKDIYRYCGRKMDDLTNKIVPFFQDNPMVTSKARDFEGFVEALGRIRDGKHLTEIGLREIAMIAEKMNRKVQSKFSESSETIRQAPAGMSEKI